MPSPRRHISQRIARWVLGLATLLGTASPALGQTGDWPTWRHDPQRTGRTSLSGDFTAPAPSWSLFTGGRAAPGSFLAADVDGTEGAELLVVKDGRVLAFHAGRGELIWDSPWLGVQAMIGVADLDGDPTTREVVVTRYPAPTAIQILAGADGHPLWTSPPLPVGISGYRRETVRLVDLDGDGHLELLASAANHPYFFAFHWDGAGFVPLWQAGFTGYDNLNPPVVGDLDGDGRPEVAFLTWKDLWVLNGEDGSLRLKLTGILRSHCYDHLEVIDAAGDGTAELLIVGRRTYSHSLTLVSVRQGAVLWQREWLPTETSGLITAARLLGDLDGDGRPELVLGLFDDRDVEQDAAHLPGDHDGVNAPGVWSLLVLDPATGVARAHLPDRVPRALADLDGDGREEIVAAESPAVPAGPGKLATLQVLRWSEAGALQMVGTIEQAVLPEQRFDPPAGVADLTMLRPLAPIAGAGGSPALIVLRDSDANGDADLLERWRLGDAGLERENTAAVDEELPSGGLLHLPEGLGGGEDVDAGELLLARGDGMVEVRRRDLSLVAALPIAGNFTASLAVATLDPGQAPWLFYTLSSGEVAAAELSDAEPNSPPLPRWRYRTGHTGPLTITEPDLAGERTLLALTVDRGSYFGLVALDARTGEERWSYEPDRWSSAEPPLTAWVGLQRRAAVLLRGTSGARSASADLRLVALDAATGELLWDVAPTVNTTGAVPLLALDLDGDGGEEILHVDASEVERFDGQTGASLGQRASDWLKHPLLGDVDGDGSVDFLAGLANEICLWSGGPTGPSSWCAPRRYRDEGQRNFAALARPGMDEPWKLVVLPTEDGLLRAWRGDNGALAWQRRLAGGEAQDTAEAGLASLADVAVADLEAGGPDEIVAGSDDGYLYLLSADSGAALWSYGLSAAPREFAVADVQADGAGELIVASADGRLQMLRPAALDPPQHVREVPLRDDGEADEQAADLDEWERLDVLAIAWDGLAGATGYRVELLTANDLPLVPWVEVGARTGWVFRGLHLTAGMSYRAQVTATSPDGQSAVGTSDGVTVLDLSPPEILSLTAQPAVFDPTAQATQILGRLRDRTDLAGWELQALDADGMLVRSWIREVRGVATDLIVDWAGDDADGVQAADGVYRLRLVATDLAGHAAEAEAQVELDSSRPLPPRILQPTAGQQVLPEVVLRGEAEGELQVLVRETGVQRCGATADPDGRWACAPARAFAAGEHTVDAVAVNRAGTVSEPSPTVTFRVVPAAGEDLGPGEPDAGAPEDGGLPDAGEPEDGGPPDGGSEGEGEGEGAGGEGEGEGEGAGSEGEGEGEGAGGEGEGEGAGGEGEGEGAPFEAPAPAEDGCWCSTGASSSPGSTTWWLAPLLLGLLRLRRRRAAPPR